MTTAKTYKVIIPYSETSEPRKKFKIEYTVSAPSRAAALKKAEYEFESYAAYNSASWIRTIEREGIRIWKLLPHLPQKPQHIDELAAQLSSEDEDIVYNTLKLLGEIEDSSASSQIIKVLSHKNPDLVTLAAETLGIIGDPSNLNVVKALYKPDANVKVKACAITAVGKMALPDDDIIDFLAVALQDEDSRVRANAIEAIDGLDIEDEVRLLIPLLKDEDNRVRANVIKSLWNKEDNVELLEALKSMTVDKNQWMRTSAVFVLDKLDIPGKLELLSAMVSDEYPQVRKNAREALFNQNGVECISYWLDMIENDEEFQMISPKIAEMGERAISPLLSYRGNTHEGRRYASMLLEILETGVLKSSGWLQWLKTKQRRMFKSE